MESGIKKPNQLLRFHRESRGWSQQKLAELVDTSEDMVSRWERGVSKTSPYYREKLCTLFGKTAQELGFLEQEYPKVSENSPMDNTLTELLQPLVEHPQCAWVITWGLGEEVSDIELVYDRTIHYESTLPDRVRQALDDWCRKNHRKCQEKKRDPVGALVRLEKAGWSHHAYKYFLVLSPSRYLIYVAIHPQLGNAQLQPLREAQLDNALKGLSNGEPLGLPSTFALHMAVVSQDGYLLLRRRASDTELYPSAWEAGIGEFMHGPEETPGPEYESGPHHSQFPHFTEKGLPDLFLFLKNAVAEELGYHQARQEHFRLYGFAVEYETLAPKLLVVYHADCTIATLLESAKKARDRARELSSLELTPSALAQACSSSHYSSWGPTSKLVMLLALKQDFMAKGREDQSSEMRGLLDCFEPKKELADAWKFHE
jgi:transcriptional regulator with XRE-family HTH domain